jgi:hypothetical protein
MVAFFVSFRIHKSNLNDTITYVLTNVSTSTISFSLTYKSIE